MTKRCAWPPRKSMGPRCMKKATALAFIGPMEYVKTCCGHRRPFEVWGRRELKKAIAEYEARQKEHFELVKRAHQVCLEQLVKGNARLAAYLLKQVRFHRFEAGELRALVAGKIPR